METTLTTHGIALDRAERLTYVRYADDLMLYASSWQELCEIVEMLSLELAAVGLSLNTSKTKLFTTACLDSLMFIEIAGDMVEVMTEDSTHKY